MAIVIQPDTSVKDRRGTTIVYNLKKYELQLNESMSKLTPQEAIDFFKGKASEENVMRHYHQGNLGACFRLYNERQFIKDFIKWYDKQKK